MPDTHGESKVSVLTQIFKQACVISQTVHSLLSLFLDVPSPGAIMNLRLLFFFLFLALLLTLAEVCIPSTFCTAKGRHRLTRFLICIMISCGSVQLSFRQNQKSTRNTVIIIGIISMDPVAINNLREINMQT